MAGCSVWLLAGLLFGNTRVDIGALRESDPVQQVRYPFVNQTEEPLLIQRVHTSCGCTVATLPQTPIAVGEEGEIVLAFLPHNQCGEVEIEALVYVADTVAARLTLCAQVSEPTPYAHYRVQMGALRLRTAQVSFLNRGAQVERIAVANTGTLPLTLGTLLAPPGVSVSTEPAVIPPMGEADLVIRMDNRKRSGQLQIILDGTGGTPSQRAITILTDSAQ